jgi:hypothetical protein
MNRKTMSEDDFIPVSNRGITGPDANGNFGISFDCKNGPSIIRMQLSPQALASFVDAATNYLAYKDSNVSNAEEITQASVSELFDKATTALIDYLIASRKLNPGLLYPYPARFSLDLVGESVRVSLGPFSDTIRRKENQSSSSSDGSAFSMS